MVTVMQQLFHLNWSASAVLVSWKWVHKPITHGVLLKCPRRSTNTVRVARCRAPAPDTKLAKKPSRSQSVEELARDVARVQGQPAGKEEEEDNEISDESGPLLVPKSARVVSGRRHHRLTHVGRPFDVSRWKVGGIACGTKHCEDTRSTSELSNRSWSVSQIREETHASSGRRRRNRLIPCCVFERLLSPGGPASPWFTTSRCSDGSSAVIQPLWFQKTSEVSPMLERMATAHAGAFPSSNASTSLGRHCNTTQRSQSSSCGSVHLHFL